MLFTSTTLAVLGLASLGSSHMIMNTPVPYGKSSLDNSPLLADGSNFPCKQRTGVYDAQGASNTYALGSTQKLAFTGSATHGGGSCQVSITYDKEPTKSSIWKVIHSIEGGCPIQGVAGNNGNNAAAVNPDTYSFTVPTTLPTGDVTLAWTWFNKIGNREMYMNCAPVTLTASTSKRSDDDQLMTRNATQLMERDTAAFNALPDMFLANIAAETTCTTEDSTDLKFPNPGDSVVSLGSATASPKPPLNCGTIATATAGSGTKASSAAASKATSAIASKATSVSAPAISGGVFATVATSKAPVASKATSVSAPAVSGGVFATVATSKTPVATSAPALVVSSSPKASSAAPVASTPVASASTPAGTGIASTAGAFTAGTACTTEGMWNCIGGTSFQQCASGTWSTVMQVAAGTKCTAGQSTAISIVASKSKAKRAIRFSSAHFRRHLHHS